MVRVLSNKEMLCNEIIDALMPFIGMATIDPTEEKEIGTCRIHVEDLRNLIMLTAMKFNFEHKDKLRVDIESGPYV
jgi:hypothetical protein